MPIKWKQFRDLEKAPFSDGLEQEQWVPFFPAFRPEEPAIDLYQDKDNLYAEIPLHGINPEHVSIAIRDNILFVEGKGEHKKEIKEKDYLRREIRKGLFQRAIKLPVEVKGDKTTAESDNGLLKITMPKVAKAIGKEKKIVIKIK